MVGIDVDGIKNYSGSAVYTKTFSVNETDLSKGTQSILKFDNIHEMTRVSINGELCGIIFTPPFQLDVTEQVKMGQNEISIEVINTWNNRLVGDVRNPDQKQYTNTNIKNKFRNGKLLPSGIIGQAFIKFVE